MIELFPFSNALFGGILIGLSALLMMLTLGRITGISGIASSLLTFGDEQNRLWRWCFVIGLIVGVFLFHQFIGFDLPFRQTPNISLLLIAGFLVGFGTVIGSGCTSGHGVCGIGRFSKRSIAATVVFMLTAMVTVLVVKFVA